MYLNVVELPELLGVCVGRLMLAAGGCVKTRHMTLRLATVILV